MLFFCFSLHAASFPILFVFAISNTGECSWKTTGVGVPNGGGGYFAPPAAVAVVNHCNYNSSNNNKKKKE